MKKAERKTDSKDGEMYPLNIILAPDSNDPDL